MSIERMLGDGGRARSPAGPAGPGPCLEDYLSILEAERKAILIHLIALEKVLVKYGRLRRMSVQLAKEKKKK